MADRRNIALSAAAACAAVASVAALAFAVSPRSRRAASVLWYGDLEAEAKRKSLRQLAKIGAVLDVAENELGQLGAAVDTHHSRLPPAEDTSGAASSENAAAANSYYHFSSSGEKFKSKWDTFDVDAALAQVDEDEQTSAELAKLRARLGGLEARLEAVLAYCDRVRGDSEVTAQRRALALRVSGPTAGLFLRVDELKAKLVACGKGAEQRRE